MRSISPFVKRFGRLAVLALVVPACAALFPKEDRTCTYRTWDWDTVQKKAVNPRVIRKRKADLTPEEKGTVPGCTVCEEDQVEVKLDGIPPFQFCRAFEERITRAVIRAKSERFPILSAVGYRVGKSKGSTDSSGLRTAFSNHSYGVAIDFNSENNGLYDFCVHFGPECKLLRGGEYRREASGAITDGSPLYSAMTSEGFKWGGEILGKQKDFMHFSLTGM